MRTGLGVRVRDDNDEESCGPSSPSWREETCRLPSPLDSGRGRLVHPLAGAPSPSGARRREVPTAPTAAASASPPRTLMCKPPASVPLPLWAAAGPSREPASPSRMSVPMLPLATSGGVQRAVSREEATRQPEAASPRRSALLLPEPASSPRHAVLRPLDSSADAAAPGEAVRPRCAGASLRLPAEAVRPRQVPPALDAEPAGFPAWEPVKSPTRRHPCTQSPRRSKASLTSLAAAARQAAEATACADSLARPCAVLSMAHEVLWRVYSGVALREAAATQAHKAAVAHVLRHLYALALAADHGARATAAAAASAVLGRCYGCFGMTAAEKVGSLNGWSAASMVQDVSGGEASRRTSIASCKDVRRNSIGSWKGMRKNSIESWKEVMRKRRTTDSSKEETGPDSGKVPTTEGEAAQCDSDESVSGSSDEGRLEHQRCNRLQVKFEEVLTRSASENSHAKRVSFNLANLDYLESEESSFMAKYEREWFRRELLHNPGVGTGMSSRARARSCPN
mmetsp:Transcript_62170/g.194926  ORF Transcript_62170/g.194926 Transcript_62170/m.194926 type:complete len:511 (-) Transcript_62170:138-1670(-)